MCLPSGQYDDIVLRLKAQAGEAADPLDSGDIDLSGIPTSLQPLVAKLGRKIKAKREQEAVDRLDLSPADPNPFAVFGPRLGVQRISDVKPGEQGKKVSVSDLKIGLT